jgi:hypothetical protein
MKVADTMRVVFLLLLLANLGFFAWDRYLREPLSAQTRIQQVQMSPEKIRLVGVPAQPTPAAKPAAAAEPEKVEKAEKVEKVARVETACLAWGVFIGPQDAARADAAMAEAKLPAAQVRRVLSDVDGHWVLIPPRKSQAEVAKVIDNLKELGISDYSIVPEPPQWRNAISLGIFRTEESARALLAEVKRKGVTDAGVERRERFFQQVTYYVREPDEAVVERLTTLRGRIAGSEVKAVACPAQFETPPVRRQE